MNSQAGAWEPEKYTSLDSLFNDCPWLVYKSIKHSLTNLFSKLNCISA